ncbi:heme-binding protein [Flavobacterium sp. AC]|uniref:Heme-binding protein n=1 Tax=Flavobacterium azizsancarii TaxID=2961580 RepID=A0ABT4WD84_9FLAO|nr:heme-binding protein [Flavobacterium azizsancarii]MDA6070075.1 heme-binding protein [Flavobacterium azizsancarii]
MRIIFLFLLIANASSGQNNTEIQKAELSINNYVTSVDNLTLDAALDINKRVTKTAALLNQKVSIALLDASGTIILITRADGVGPHNAEAARRKAYTALSTKTATLTLLRNAEKNPDTKNLNTLPELLLLSGGIPIWYKGNIIGSIGVAGGGNPENDDLIAKSAAIAELGITTTK